jgi:putative N6-adenine-specific DNA methylase
VSAEGERLSCWAVTHPGVEAVTARELQGLGLVPTASEPGGVAFDADLGGLYAANLHLRTASRVLVRAADDFRAASFAELERRAKRVPWTRFVAPGGAVRFRVTSRKSKLYHQDAVAERLAGALQAAVPGASVVARAADEEAHEEGVQLVVVRLFRDRVTVSVDASGALLHRRGYRLAVAKAPLRETLAAAMLLAAGWDADGGAPLVDPFCGSGTIPIEAALLARRIAPGLARDFAFRRWPGFDAALWGRLVDEARAAVRPAPGPIVAADRDAGAVDAARANAARAGVLDDIELRRAPLSALVPPARPGCVVTNPPYGARVGERLRLRDLYAQLGNLARARLAGWRVAMLSPHADLEHQTRLAFRPLFDTNNGGIHVRLVAADLPPEA